LIVLLNMDLFYLALKAVSQGGPWVWILLAWTAVVCAAAVVQLKWPGGRDLGPALLAGVVVLVLLGVAGALSGVLEPWAVEGDSPDARAGLLEQARTRLTGFPVLTAVLGIPVVALVQIARARRAGRISLLWGGVAVLVLAGVAWAALGLAQSFAQPSGAPRTAGELEIIEAAVYSILAWRLALTALVAAGAALTIGVVASVARNLEN